MQMAISAARGVVQLGLDVKSRVEFSDYLDNKTIDDEVISQATAGTLMVFSLFHGLQNPLFKQHNFDAKDFLSGVRPALEQFHNVSGELENKLRKIRADAKVAADFQADEDVSKPGNTPSPSEAKDAGTVNNPQDTAITLGFTETDLVKVDITGDKSLSTLIEHDWRKDAESNPESPAGQFSHMVTPELLELHQNSAKAAIMFDLDRDVSFKEGSCTVSNVAFISARAFLCAEKPTKSEDIDEWGERSDLKYEIIDYEMTDAEFKRRKGGVAAQVEVLYDVTQEFEETLPKTPGDGDEEGAKEKITKKDIDSTNVSVAVLEGWLSGGPDDELRWRVALNRPAFEFPYIRHKDIWNY